MDNAAARVKAACRSSFNLAIRRSMKKDGSRPEDDRARRLAQALRANLHRRKAQARALDEPADAGDADTAKPDQ